MTPGEPGDLPGAVMADLLEVLDLVILERLPGGAMTRVGDRPPPAWFAETFYKEHPRQAVTLLEAFPVLDGFMSEAGPFWEQTANGRLDGDTCIVSGPGGENLPLALTAVATGGRHFLLIQRVPGYDDQQRILQIAREQGLEQEQVVKRIDLLRRPVTNLRRLTGELAGMELGEVPRTHLAGVTTEVEKLRELLDALPQLPRGASARRPLG